MVDLALQEPAFLGPTMRQRVERLNADGLPYVRTDLAPVSPDTQAVAIWAAMNSRGERIFSPECGWLSL